MWSGVIQAIGCLIEFNHSQSSLELCSNFQKNDTTSKTDVIIIKWLEAQVILYSGEPL